MFSWFKHSIKTDPVAAAIELAESAVIESVFENGRYNAFFIKLSTSGQPSDLIKNQTAISAFVERVEKRLDANDFEPVLEDLNRELHEAIGSVATNHSADRAIAPRAVLSSNEKLIFKWNR